MAIVVDATPGGLTSNSYVTVAEAADYVNIYVLDEAARDVWLDLDTDDKSRLLIQATRQLDWYFCWQGERTNQQQALEWPRYQVYRDSYPIPQDEIPWEIKHATIEEALWLQTIGDNTPLAGNALIDEVEVGEIRVNFNEKANQSKIYVPDKIAAIINGFGEIEAPSVPTSGMAKNISLVRA